MSSLPANFAYMGNLYILTFLKVSKNPIKGAFVWDQSGIRILGIMQVSVRLAALPIPEYLDFHSGYSAPRSRIAGIYSRIYSYFRIFPNERALSEVCV